MNCRLERISSTEYLFIMNCGVYLRKNTAKPRQSRDGIKQNQIKMVFQSCSRQKTSTERSPPRQKATWIRRETNCLCLFYRIYAKRHSPTEKQGQIPTPTKNKPHAAICRDPAQRHITTPTIPKPTQKMMVSLLPMLSLVIPLIKKPKAAPKQMVPFATSSSQAFSQRQSQNQFASVLSFFSFGSSNWTLSEGGKEQIQLRQKLQSFVQQALKGVVAKQQGFPSAKKPLTMSSTVRKVTTSF